MLENQVHVSPPAWSGKVLIAAAIHCAAWGLFILALPAKSAVVYGFAEPPVDLFLWQGTGLMILLFGIGYGIAARNPDQHWAVLLLGLIAKVLGPIGMVQSVLTGAVPAKVLILIPFNDLIWWIPFTVILHRVYRRTRSQSATES